MVQTGILRVQYRSSAEDYWLGEGTINLGRAADNHIVLNDTTISRYHARIEARQGKATLVDLGSANGSSLNNQPLSPNAPRPIQPGDKIQLGDIALELMQSGEAGRLDANGQALPQDKPAVLVWASAVEATLLVIALDASQEYPMQEAAYSIGREGTNEIVINQPVVSRRHARLEKTAHGYSITDLGSANGLTLRGARVSSLLLADGDELSITGDVTLTYKLSRTEAQMAPTIAVPAIEAMPAHAAIPPQPTPAAPQPELEAPAVSATMMGAALEPVIATQRIDLRQRSTLTIGRSPESDVVLEHPTISRQHARVARVGKEDQFIIEDMGSSNGTRVNDELVEAGKPYPLRPGDTIRIGPIKFTFAPEVIQTTDESLNMRLDALHLNQWVGKGVNLLQDISLAVLPREFVAVVGVSGAGKSTFMNALSGFKPASDGTVMVNGTDLYKNYNSYRTDIGYVPQDDIIHRELPVGRALDYVARLRLPADMTTAERKKVVGEEMDTLGLAERKNVPVGNLSGGQRKRVSIGVERITRPGLFFLDEATSGLDPGTENQLMRMLRQLADQGQTILLITHATKNVVLCDLVVFLAKGGHLAYFGPPSQALEYFGVKDFDEIYEKIMNEKSPKEWSEIYHRSPQYRTYVVERLQSKYGELLEVTPKTPVKVADSARAADRLPKKKVKQPSGFRQFVVLTQRYLDIIRSDKRNLLLLFLLAPILGLLGFLIWENNIFDPIEGESLEVMTMLFLASIIPFLIGSLGSMREIVKEKAIYVRERTVNLKILPYVASKILIGLLLSLYSAAAILAVMVIKIDFSHMEFEEIALFYLLLVVSVMTGVMWGLLISALASREEQAVLLVILVVVLHMVFSGGLFALNKMDEAGDVLGSITSTKWVFEGMADVTGLMEGDCDTPGLSNCEHPGIQGVEGTGAEKEFRQAENIKGIRDKFGDVFEGDVYESLLADLAIMVVLFGLILVIQKRKDVI